MTDLQSQSDSAAAATADFANADPFSDSAAVVETPTPEPQQTSAPDSGAERREQPAETRPERSTPPAAPAHSAPSHRDQGHPQAGAERQAGGDEPSRQVPLATLIEERNRWRQHLQALEQEKQQWLREQGAYAAMLEMQRQQLAPKPEAPKAPETPPAPDPFVDPQGYGKWVQDRAAEKMQAQEQTMQRQMALMEVQTRFATSRAHHTSIYGPEAIDRVTQWVNSLGPRAGQHYSRQPDPVGAAIRDYNHAAVLQEVGNDPQAYRQSALAAERERMRQELIAELRQQGVGGQPAPQAPPSLATQSRASAASALMASWKQDGDDFFNGRPAQGRH